MRTKLKAVGTRERYKATIGRCGIKYNNFKKFPERTAVMKDVTLISTGEIVTDHLWTTIGKTLSKLELKSGDVIYFDARVGTYKKGNHFSKRDFKLNRLTKIEVQRTDRKILEDEITTGTPASIQEWNDVQDLNRLKKEYPDDSPILNFDHEVRDFERLGELKKLFKKRYFEAATSERNE